MWALALKRAGAFFLLLIALSEAALAHGAERGFVMLLPTGHFILGGAAAVLVSFLVLAFIPAEAMARVFSQGSMREPSITALRQWAEFSGAPRFSLCGLCGVARPACQSPAAGNLDILVGCSGAGECRVRQFVAGSQSLHLGRWRAASPCDAKGALLCAGLLHLSWLFVVSAHFART
jgi:hypothetical protein